MVLVCGSCSGLWPTARQAPKALWFKWISDLIKNNPVEAEAITQSLAMAKEISVAPGDRRLEESPIAFACENKPAINAGAKEYKESGPMDDLAELRMMAAWSWGGGVLTKSTFPAAEQSQHCHIFAVPVDKQACLPLRLDLVL